MFDKYIVCEDSLRTTDDARTRGVGRGPDALLPRAGALDGRGRST